MTGLNLSFFRSLQNIKVPPVLKKLFYPLRFLVGLFLILFGIVGIILPVLPGWVPLILGVMIISPKYGKLLAIWVYNVYRKYIVRFLIFLKVKVSGK